MLRGPQIARADDVIVSVVLAIAEVPVRALPVREDGVMFLADCFYPPPAHRRTPDSAHDRKMFNGLLDRGLEQYIDGHSGAYSRTAWRGWLSMV